MVVTRRVPVRSTSHLYHAASVAQNLEDRKYTMYFRKSPILNSTFFKTDKPSGFRKMCLSTMSHLEWALHMTKPFFLPFVNASLRKPKEPLHILPYCL